MVEFTCPGRFASVDHVCTVRVAASAAARCSRGWVYDWVKDEHLTETELDGYPFALKFDNSTSDSSVVTRWMSAVLLPAIEDPVSS